jgi:L-ascorbate metabolism protein UlaG (beta-lactamase superfamily)
MKRNRRKFLKYMAAGTGTTLGLSFYWLSTSKRWAAKFTRQLVSDARRAVVPAPISPKPLTWPEDKVTMAWIGHSTMLINFYGVRILTDPVFGSRIGVHLGLGTVGIKRYVAPALRLNQLPPIDLVLLSHAHMDHMDLGSLGGLSRVPSTVSAKATQDVFAGVGFKDVRELGWGDRTIIKSRKGDLELTAFEVRHWGQRWPRDIARGYNGYILKRDGKSILFGGDTADTPLFKDLRSKGPFHVAIMPIGAYQPWVRSHCTPEQALAMANAAGAHYFLPVHHQAFKLSEEPMEEPIQRLQAAISQEPERLAVKRVGETFVLPGA